MPTLAAVATTDKTEELRADWEHMLGHQLPVLPPVDEYLDTLAELFAWLEGAAAPVLEPVPTREALEPGWAAPATIEVWPGQGPIEQIRFAGANHLLVELGYQDRVRLIEPYSLRRSKAGHLLIYAVKAQTGEIRAYRTDRIQSVRVTPTSFLPRYAVELSTVLPVRSGPRRRR